MATQGYGSAPGRNASVNAGTSPPRSVSTKPVPIIMSHMKPADAKAMALKTKSRSK